MLKYFKMCARRRRIAILCGQADEEFQKLFIEGFEKQAFECGFDVCVFAMYMKFQEKKIREAGESQIFALVNYEQFDAFVVLADTIQTPGVLGALEERLHKEANMPVLFVDKESQYFQSVFLKHYEAIVKLTEHLIVDHGFKDIAFISGKEWHPHSKERIGAFVDTMNRHDLPINDNRIFYGDFWYSSGFEIADKFCNEGIPLPEAFACANDYMAIGLAGALVHHGIRVPEDVAVIGYDSVEEGRMSPSPITSIPLPVEQYGDYVASSINRLINNEPLEPFCPDYELFLGGSCGCHCESVVPKVMLRDGWKADLFARPFYSYDNRLAEDMSVASDLEEMLGVIKSYMYQIGEFDSFRICLNSEWVEGGPITKTDGYSDTMYEVMSLRNGGKEGGVSLDNPFPLKDILPDIHENHDEPVSYLFTPLHFNEATFGFVVLSYGHKVVGMDVTYLFWLRTVMMGFEALRRRRVFVNVQNIASRIRFMDSLTGLYNYEGLVGQMMNLIGPTRNHVDMTLIAVDISGIGLINEKFGRREGDKVIVEFSKILKSGAGENSICGRLGNDEFIIAHEWKDESTECVDSIVGRLCSSLDESNKNKDNPITFEFGFSTMKVSNISDIEKLINSAVSNKNGNKIRSRKLQMSGSFSDEDKKMAERVADLLDNNKFDYHFQPIVDTRTGNIFAYEALMRPISDPYIAPPVVIEYASRLGRVEEVEKLTFLNVLGIIEKKLDILEGKKVFINSLPGIRVQGKVREEIINRLKKISYMVVIELTEHSELDDQTLDEMKERYRDDGFEMAVDDYGTGYSNVVNLLRYMPDYVKIDRMLLAGIEENPQKQHFVSEVVKFAHDNDFKVLAEGVETSNELETCIRLGADYIQGYYTGRPDKEILRELPSALREEIFQYSEVANTDLMGTGTGI